MWHFLKKLFFKGLKIYYRIKRRLITGDDENAISEGSQDNKNHVDDSSLKLKALAACRILSRDCTDLNESIEDNHVDLLSHVIDSTSIRLTICLKITHKIV